jgi:uncharacterized protein (TIGR02646 family)
MRPVDKGTNATSFTQYPESKNDLLEQIGEYCSYCERSTDLAVEHKKPKSKYPEHELEWTNFLLGCVNCNSIKKDKDTGVETHFFPDEVNTAHVFIYGPDAQVHVNPALSDEEKQAAQRTLELVGLERVPPPDPKRRDDRWVKRDRVWGKARESRENLEKQPSDEMRRQIVLTAVENGFFSVWMAVFSDDTQMCALLIQAFPGTRATCFDVRGQVVSRLSLSAINALGAP